MNSYNTDNVESNTQELHEQDAVGLADILRLTLSPKDAGTFVADESFWESWVSHMELKHNKEVMDALEGRGKWLNYQKLRAQPRGRKIYGISTSEAGDVFLARESEDDTLFSPLQIPAKGTDAVVLCLPARSIDVQMNAGSWDHYDYLELFLDQKKYDNLGDFIKSTDPPKVRIFDTVKPAMIRTATHSLVAALYENGDNDFLVPRGESYELRDEWSSDEANLHNMIDYSSIAVPRDWDRSVDAHGACFDVSLLPDGTLVFKDGSTYADPSGRAILTAKLFRVPFFVDDGDSDGFKTLIALVMDGGVIQIYTVVQSVHTSGRLRRTKLADGLPELKLDSAIVSIETRFPPIDPVPRGGRWQQPENLYGSEVQGESLLVVVTASPVDNLFVLAFDGYTDLGIVFSVTKQGVAARHAQEVEGKGIYYSVATEYSTDDGNLFIMPVDGSCHRRVELPEDERVLYVGNGSVLTTKI